MPVSLSERPGVVSFAVLRRFCAVFFPAAFFAGGVVLALYYQERVNEESLHAQACSSLVNLHADIIAREMKSVESDLLYLADQAVLRRYLADGVDATRELQEEYVLFCRQRAVYDQIRYLDADGRERVRINFNDGTPAIVPQSELQPKADRYYFTEAVRLERGGVFVSSFDLNVEHGKIERPIKPTIRFATPVFDAGGAKRGVLVLNYLGAALLRKLAEVAHSFAGHALLVNGDGYYLRGPTREQEWGFMLGHGQAFAADDPEAWQCIQQRQEGECRTAAGLIAFRAVVPSSVGSARPAGERLIAVAQTPPDVLDAGSDRFLRRMLLLYVVLLVMLLPLAWYLAYVGSLRRAHERQLEESESRLRALSTQLITAQEEERRGLSRDLHDELGQVVTAITLDLQRAGQAAEPGKKDDLIGRALRGADCLLDRIHQISARVRPAMLDDLGLRDAVQSLVSDFERRTGIVPHVDLQFAKSAVPAAISANVYRILQEALTNVARHAETTDVTVRLHATSSTITLSVRDAGVGFDPASLDGKRLGILGMRERAELLGGTFALKAAPGSGTEIEVVLPVAERAD
jgi:signal transduction histidine kinase